MTTIPFDEAELAATTIAPEPVILRQTPLSRYARCPFQGLAVELGLVDDVSAAADAGSENHRIIAEAIAEHIAGGDFRDYLCQEKAKARPDVQQEVCEALSRSAWSVGGYLRYKVLPGAEYPDGIRRSPEDVLVYQGGTGKRDPQLAWDILPAAGERGPIRITSEIDLLVAGASAEELEETDFKRWQSYSGTDILKSFQFRCHAWLIFRNYPDCQTIRVRTWSLPRNECSPWVTFSRRDADDFTCCLLSTVDIRQWVLGIADRARTILENDKLPMPQPEAALVAQIDQIASAERALEVVSLCWPDGEKCVICPAVRLCPRATRPAVDLNIDPERYARETQVMEIALDQRLADLRAYVDQHGDIEGPDVAFGLNGPKPNRKPSAVQYRFREPDHFADARNMVKETTDG